MTDREMLELAAKAGRYNVFGWNGECFLKKHDNGNLCQWNPIDDDGDAFRLAVKCGIDVFGDGKYRRAEIDNWNCAEPSIPDPYAATRRAIVRAAAEIGRSMK